ncbi:MAG: manganese-binding transcriptional regulator MntR [Hyphomicrobiaceae bacterium]
MADPDHSDRPDPERSERPDAERYRRVREAHQTELAEDYVELIGDLIAETGEARVVDLAERLGVSSATVNNSIQRLQRDGLVTSKPYRAIFLTERGQEMAAHARDRHKVVLELLLALGVDAATAELDAEGIEHHVSEATLAAFRTFLAQSKVG